MEVLMDGISEEVLIDLGRTKFICNHLNSNPRIRKYLLENLHIVKTDFTENLIFSYKSFIA